MLVQLQRCRCGGEHASVCAAATKVSSPSNRRSFLHSISWSHSLFGFIQTPVMDSESDIDDAPSPKRSKTSATKYSRTSGEKANTHCYIYLYNTQLLQSWPLNAHNLWWQSSLREIILPSPGGGHDCDNFVGVHCHSPEGSWCCKGLRFTTLYMYVWIVKGSSSLLLISIFRFCCIIRVSFRNLIAAWLCLVSTKNPL